MTVPALALATLAVIGGPLRADEPRGKSGTTDSRLAAVRARACVCVVECTDPRDADAAVLLSAVVFDRDGHLVTVGLRPPGERRLCVRDCDGKQREARWIGADDQTGLTLLKVDSALGSAASLRTEPPDLGTPVFVVGNPFGLAHSVSVGNISGLDRRVSASGWTGRGLVQFTAPVFPGDSGGLLADHDGRMLGIVCTAFGDPDVENSSGGRRVTGIGFAISAADVNSVASRLREGKKVERGYLGVSGERTDQGGVRVTRVSTGSPAAAAGLKVGDVIARIDDVAVRDFDDLALRLDRTTPGTVLKMAALRDGAETQFTATLGERTGAADRPSFFGVTARQSFSSTLAGRARDGDGRLLGVQTQVVTERLAKSLGLSSTEGALISSVMNDSPADRAGLRPSDLIVLLDQRPVRSPQELDEQVRAAAPRGNVKVEVLRSGRTESLVVKLGDRLVIAPSEASVLRFMPRSTAIENTGRTNQAIEQRVRVLEQRIEELERRLREKDGSSSPNQEN